MNPGSFVSLFLTEPCPFSDFRSKRHTAAIVVPVDGPTSSSSHGISLMLRVLVGTAIIVLLAASPLTAEYIFELKGTWPESWPKELESLRSQAKTYEGPLLPLQHYGIPFKNREEFETAWPHILTLKSQGAPIVLRRSPNFWLGKGKTAGVCIHTPPRGQAPISGDKDTGNRWERTIYIELIVDGAIVDLNDTFLPPDTPIVDERFKKRKK